DSEDGRVRALQVFNKAGNTRIEAPWFIDASGDGDLATLAGAPYASGEDGQFQPVSIMFRMAGVDTKRLLNFVREAPQHFALGESDAIRGGRTDAQIAEELLRQNQPTVFLKGNGPLLESAIQRGEMYPTALIMIQPTSTARQDRKSTRLNSSHVKISYAAFCLKKQMRTEKNNCELR